MERNRLGLTPEEREHLAAQPENGREMDLKMSLLAFTCLLLVCALILAASMIARSQGKSDIPNIRSAPPQQESPSGFP